MTLGADPAELDALARSIAAHADAARARASGLARAARDTAWHGNASAAFARCADEAVQALLGSAQRLDAAAAALHRHARAVEQARLIDDAAARARSTLAGSGSVVSHACGGRS